MNNSTHPKIGDKYKERMLKKSYFDYTLEVVGFKKESYGEFADCTRTYPDGKTEKVGISVDLLRDETFYKKI